MSLVDKIINRLNLSPTKAKIMKNIYWAMLGKVVTLLGGLFVGILVARYLGPEQYGLMNYVISYVSIFQILASFGFDDIEIREESKYNGFRDKIIGTAFLLKLVLAVITIFLVIGTALLFESGEPPPKINGLLPCVCKYTLNISNCCGFSSSSAREAIGLFVSFTFKIRYSYSSSLPSSSVVVRISISSVSVKVYCKPNSRFSSACALCGV